MKDNLSSGKWRYLTTITVAFLLIFLLYAKKGVRAFDYYGRIDTRYQYRTGDEEADQDIYQYHAFDLDFSKNLSFQWNGGLRYDIDGKNTSTSGLNDPSDVALRGLPDAANKDMDLEYRVYSAFVKYTTGIFGTEIGRSLLWDYEFSHFDGAKLRVNPMGWFFVEGFAGKPWHYGYYNDYSKYWDESEFIGGGGAVFDFRKQKLNFALRYLNLRELTEKTTETGEASDTFLSNDNLSRATLSYTPLMILRADISASFIDAEGRNINAGLSGYNSKYLFTYRVNYHRQFMDVEDYGSRLSQYSYFLSANHPYQKASASVTKSLADVFGLTGPVSDIEIEAGYEYRGPVDLDERDPFNPEYQLIRGGVLAATNVKCYLNIFYENIFTTGDRNDTRALGGEVSKKWKKLTVKLGSAYFVHKYEQNYSDTVIKDSFSAREYYFDVKWMPVKFLDVSLKASYEQAELSSLTDTSKQNQDVVSEPMTEIITDPRDYMKIKLKVGYMF